MIFTIDIGGTKIAAALFSNDGEIIEKAEVASCIHEDFQSLPGLIYNSFWHLASLCLDRRGTFFHSSEKETAGHTPGPSASGDVAAHLHRYPCERLIKDPLRTYATPDRKEIHQQW